MEISEMTTIPVRSGDMIVVRMNLKQLDPGSLQVAVSAINSAVQMAVGATGAQNVGMVILDEGSKLELMDADKLARCGLRRMQPIEQDAYADSLRQKEFLADVAADKADPETDRKGQAGRKKEA